MPELSSFRPYRYNPTAIPDLGAVIAPPYDVISPEKRESLIARDPHNVIQLILPEGDETTRYKHAADLLQEWIASDILAREELPGIYAYAQIFKHPESGVRIERRGFIAAVRLSPFSEGKILPHERTLSGPKADRLQLMLATRANLEPIFGVYRDSYGASGRKLEQAARESTPLLSATDSDGVEHRLWRLTNEQRIRSLQDDLERNTIFIVDGHHRYETALNYQRMVREQNPALPEGSPCDYIMMFLAPTSDPGLVILPTHRVVHSLPAFDLDELAGRLRSHFDVRVPASRAEGIEELRRQGRHPGFLLLSGEHSIYIALRADANTDDLFDAGVPTALKQLDVSLLHDYIFQRLLGITPEAQAEQRNILYVKSIEEAMAAADRPEVQLVAVMNATRLQQVESVAESGTVMPQKSTYFYPKLASGLLFNPLE